MKHKNLKNIIRIQTLPRLFIPLIICIVIVTVLIINPFKHALFPTSVKNIADVTKMYEDGNDYIKYTADKLYYTGLDYSIGNKTKANIYYTTINGICYFVIMSENKQGNGTATVLNDVSFTAQLINNDTTFDSIIASMSDQLNFTVEGMREICCPVLISQYDYTRDFTRFAIISIYVLSLFSALFALTEVLVLIKPDLSFSVFRLRYYGKPSVLFKKAAKEFETAMATGRKNIYITDTFLISITKTDTDIIPLENIVWIYNYNEIQHQRGLTKLLHPLCIVTDRKKVFKIKHLSQKVSDTVINKILSRYPEILVGYKSRN